MRHFLIILALVLRATAAFAQPTPAEGRPTPFRFGIRVIPGTRPVDNVIEGVVYQDSTTHKIYVYNGSTWVQLGGVVDTGTAGQVLTSEGNGVPVWADVSGSGVPGGGAGAVQYKNGGNFGGTTLTYSAGAFTAAFTSSYAGAWLKSTQGTTSESTEHFELVVGSASNDTGPGDTRPDRVAGIGWNVTGAATGALPNGTGVGSNQLSFETYCSYGTGCLGGGGGQSETYFSMDDGYGHSVRPLGFFQSKFQDPDTDGQMSVIARANTWGYFDSGQNYQVFAIDSNEYTTGVGTVRFFNSIANFNFDIPGAGYYTPITMNGNAALGLGDNGIEVGRAGSVDLAPGGDGSSYVLVTPASFRTSSNTIFDASGVPRFSYGAGSATNYGSVGSAGTDEVIVEPLGSTSNILLTLQSQGNGDVRLNPAGTGASRIGNHIRSVGTAPTVAGTTSNACGTTSPSVVGTDTAGRITVGATSGTSCTVTFHQTYVSSVPICTANNETTAGAVKATASTSTLVLAGTFTAGDKLTFICIEY